MSDLDYFVGKPCTVTTVAINFRFNVEPMMEFFMGIVEKIDKKGILMTSTHTGCKNYIRMKHVVSISDEPVLYEDNPEHKKIIDEYRKTNPITAAKTKMPEPAMTPIVTPPPIPAPPKFVDPKSLAKLAQKAKEVYGKPSVPAVAPANIPLSSRVRSLPDKVLPPGERHIAASVGKTGPGLVPQPRLPASEEPAPSE